VKEDETKLKYDISFAIDQAEVQRAHIHRTPLTDESPLRTKGSAGFSPPPSKKDIRRRTFPFRPTLPIGRIQQNGSLVFRHYPLPSGSPRVVTSPAAKWRFPISAMQPRYGNSLDQKDSRATRRTDSALDRKRRADESQARRKTRRQPSRSRCSKKERKKGKKKEKNPLEPDTLIYIARALPSTRRRRRLSRGLSLPEFIR